MITRLHRWTTALTAAVTRLDTGLRTWTVAGLVLLLLILALGGAILLGQ